MGIGGIVLQWFRKFLTGRTKKVRINNSFSEILEMLFGVPQGSVLGPKLFNIYVRSQPKVFNSCRFVSSSFADDTNGMKTFSLTFQYNVLKNDIEKCMKEITKWINMMFLKINPDKTEILLLYAKSMEQEVIIRGAFVEGQCIRFSNAVKNVGVWLDKHLNLSTHINKIVSQCYMLLRKIGKIRKVLTQKHTEMLVHAVTSSRLDYGNSLFYNMSKENLYKLQKVQNAAARLVYMKKKTDSVSHLLNELHWLPVESRILFKILLIVFKVLHGQCSKNLSVNYKGYNCRTEDLMKLEVIAVKTKHGERTFAYAAPRLWNALPLEMRTIEKIETFKSKLKTLLFTGADGLKGRAFRYTR